MSFQMKRYHRVYAAGVIALTVSMTGCDVTNPGTIPEEGLVTSQQALVDGAHRLMSELMGYGTYTQALLAREIFPAGQIGAFGHDVTIQGGHLPPGTAGSGRESSANWADANQTRFIAETAIVRFTEVGAPDEMLFQAHIWAGYVYRVMGEWWCDAVVEATDADPLGPPGAFEEGTNTYFQRAVDNFTAALGYASGPEETAAALAGRAQAYVWLEQWQSAYDDAAAITDTGFEFVVNFDDLEDDYYNTLFWANAWDPYASYSMHYTFFKDHYEATGDPRTPVYEDAATPLGVGALSGYGPVEWSNQAKYTSRNDDQRLSSYWEMRLIMAEAILEGAESGAFADAMTLINEVRTRNISDLAPNDPLPAVAAANATEAWTALKEERELELFLEGRRLADERRWMENGTPGTLNTPDWDALSPIFTDNPRSYCLDIPRSERDSNPNVPASTG
jgi:starch-binding outer membrane protein, SusD/RagB family